MLSGAIRMTFPGAFGVTNDNQHQPLIDRLYCQYIENQNTASFIKQVGQRYTIATLERLLERGTRRARRAAVLAIGYLGDYDANTMVGRALTDHDRTVRMLAENAIRSLWCRAGTTSQRKLLGIIIRMNSSQQFDQAIESSTRLVDIAPWIAEAWNQRAISFFSTNRFADAVRDCHQTLEINPYHFGAATGMGYCYLRLEDASSALECFRRALRLNPGLEAVRAQLVQIQRSLKEEEN